ncbi:MAG: GNAT family N-acetyltransferase, partial [Planctomycetota bacterium]
KEHVRKDFDCGKPALDDFLERHARQNDTKGIGRTFVALEPGDSRVYGYLTIRNGSIEFEDLPPEEKRKLPRYDVPVVHIARLAVDRRAAGQGLGKILLVEALGIALEVSESIGVRAVEVIAKDEESRSFYRKFGFQSLEEDELHLYLPLETARLALRKQ